jgi:hypothetical protein
VNKQTFLNIVRDPTNIGVQDIAGLEEVVASFPFCQAAHLLIAKGSRDYGSMHAEQKIKKAAAYCLDRKKFKEVIQREKAAAQTIVEKKELSGLVKPSENELPTVDNILRDQKEPESLKRKYEEIEENLKLIELFRTEANKKPTELTSISPEEIKEEELTVKEENQLLQSLPVKTEEIIVDAVPEDKLEAPAAYEELPHAYIYSSRLEDVFLQELEIDSVHHRSEADLLLNYLEFIYENKLGKMRDKKKQKEIIEKFIHADPVIPALKPDALKENQEDLASESGKINKNPVSETFAKILALQGKKQKAIEIYEQLILKFPEKKAYFAAEIDKLKK